MKCICRSLDFDKTGHREDCPVFKTPPVLIRRATNSNDNVNSMVAELLRTVKSQNERIEKLEKLLISKS